MASVTSVLDPNYDRQKELKAFDETRLGVKGLVDTGLSKVPRMFVNQQEHNCVNKPPISHDSKPKLAIPTIDLAGIENDPKMLEKVVAQISDACENWGFFQIINHGIPQDVADEIVNGVRRFHELDDQVKKQYYARDYILKPFGYISNYFLYKGPVTNWRDTLYAVMAPNPPQPEDLPIECRDSMFEFTNHVTKLSDTLFELISRALGLNPTHFKDMKCDEELLLLGHYYPPSPEPDATIGFSKHADNNVLTILVQDQVGGLQVWHQNTWVDVPPIPGALVVNVGDFFQLITNDKIKSVHHRVVSKEVGPRVSMTAFFKPTMANAGLYGPIEELITEENPPIYKKITFKDYMSHYYNRGQDGTHVLEEFKLRND